jgi:hypothetical protein
MGVNLIDELIELTSETKSFTKAYEIQLERIEERFNLTLDNEKEQHEKENTSRMG